MDEIATCGMDFRKFTLLTTINPLFLKGLLTPFIFASVHSETMSSFAAPFSKTKIILDAKMHYTIGFPHKIS